MDRGGAIELVISDLKENIKYIIKRDGRKEPFSSTKFKRYLMYVTDNNEVLADILLRDTVIKLREETKVKALANAIVDTAVSKISPLQTVWEFVAARAYLLNLYSESYGLKDGNKYPHLAEVLKKGAQKGTYSKDILAMYSEEEIQQLNDYIRPQEDLTFTYDALKQFVSKYCKDFNKSTKLELPQITYMRVAMGISYNLEFRVNFIKKLYDILTKGQATLATPIMMNSFTPLNQYSSCILNTMGNSTSDIANKVKTAMEYTKGRGGLAFDVSHIQAKGTPTNNGTSASGLIPYIHNIQYAIVSMMQGDNRRGSGVITCRWWHYEISEFLELKDASAGTPDNRALLLKYAFATDDVFKRAVLENRDVKLFCPKQAHELLYLSGQEFEDKYNELCEKPGMYSKTVNAKELFKKYIKYRFQTGNIYETMLDNINKANMTNRFIGSSNLCAEVLEPSRPAENFRETYTTDEFGVRTFKTEWENEEIALCNLAAFNVCISELPKDELDEIVYVINKALDNTIDIGRYMRPSGKVTNMDYRYIGLGMSNKAYWLADSGILFDSDEAEVATFLMTQKLQLSILRSQARLAKELGTYPKYGESKWAEGVLPIDLANEILLKQFGHLLDTEAIEEVRGLIAKYGVRNGLSTANMPTASSSTSRGLTESVEPVMQLSYQLEGAVSTQVLVPDLARLRPFYQTAYSINPKRLVKLNAIRQMWLDQSQSSNMYIDKSHWDYEYLAKLHMYAWALGTKTLYYLWTPKSEVEEACDNCSA